MRRKTRAGTISSTASDCSRRASRSRKRGRNWKLSPDRLAADHSATNAGVNIRVINFREEMTGDDGKALTLLIMGAVIFVHLIACANVANLLLARAATRTKEVAVRCALGAGRWQIVRGLLTESMVLGVAGSLLGLIFAVWGIDLMVAAIPIELPYWLQISLDWRVLVFAIGAGLLSSILFGLVPAWQASKPELVDSLKEGGRSGVGGSKGQRVRNGLVVAEVALALALLIGAGLMLRSFLAVQSYDIGIDPKNTLTFRVGLPPSQYPDKQVAARFFQQLLPKLTEIPGVVSAGATTSLPAAGDIGADAIVLRGDEEPKQLQDSRLARTATITPGYFQTCRIALLRGRDFTLADNKDAPRVAIIDERAANLWFPNQDPIGQQLRGYQRSGEPSEWATIIGVVRRVIYANDDRKRVVARRLYRGVSAAGVVHVRDDADRARSEIVRQRRAHGRAVREQGPPHLSRLYHGGSGLQFVLGEKILRQPLCHLCRARALPGRDRFVWRDVLLCAATHPGDRCAHGPGRPGARRLQAGHRARSAPDRSRSAHWLCRLVFPDEINGEQHRGFRARSATASRSSACSFSPSV